MCKAKELQALAQSGNIKEFTTRYLVSLKLSNTEETFDELNTKDSQALVYRVQ